MGRRKKVDEALDTTPKVKKISPLFHILNSITYTKENVFEDGAISEKDYNSFMLNRFLSGERDTVIFANEMNIRYSLPKRLQYEFLKETIRPRKRYTKWLKSTEDSEVLNDVATYYQVSARRAREYLTILQPDQVQEIRRLVTKGGKS